MNLLCFKCGRGFSVTADQFGTRGKCPHCHATIVVPHLQMPGRTPTPRPTRTGEKWLDRSFSGAVAIGLHLLAFAILAMTPWQRPLAGTMGSGVEIKIGALPAKYLHQPDWEPLELQSEQNVLESESLESLVWEPLAPDPSAQSTTNIPLAGQAAGGEANSSLAQLAPPWLDSAAGGGQEAFTEMLSQLRKEGLDIVILFDSTGSMSGEISQVKTQIRRIGGVLLKLVPETRIGICAYRDRGDEYVVQGLPLTESLGEVVGFLSRIEAAGGGDTPEAVHEGMQWVIDNNTFRERARKVILIFGDAPPHPSRQLDCLRLASNFRRGGGVVSTITCRSAQPLEPFAEISRLGGGEAFLTSDQRQIMSRLIVLVFGSQHQEKVLELFRLLDQ